MRKLLTYCGMLILTCVLSNIFALNPILKKKYPFMVLTDDYGLLTKKDLAGYTVYLKNYEKFSGKDNGLVYWQCFPRENITIILKDKGYSSEDVGWKDTMADLEILVWIRQRLYHQYFMRRSFTVDNYQEDFNVWRKLMRNEKYVCISGHFVAQETNKEGNVICSWIFDKIKTKKRDCVLF